MDTKREGYDQDVLCRAVYISYDLANLLYKRHFHNFMFFMVSVLNWLILETTNYSAN